jgi:Arc/MetJ-type ribon-helix-helix transcriptional regulator
MRSVMVQLSEDQIARLDVEAARKGVSRSSVVRSAVDESLRPRFDQTVADQYAVAYPDGKFGSDEWGSLDDWHEAASKSRGLENPNGDLPDEDSW